MKKFKFTAAERIRVQRWLEKHVKSEDTQKTLMFATDAGDEVHLSRTTTYLPGHGGPWKVRTAYVTDTGYPVMTTGPLPSHIDNKGGGPKKQHEYIQTEDLPSPSIIPGPSTVTFKIQPPAAKKKAVANKDAFAKVLAAELKATEEHLLKQIQHQINNPNALIKYFVGDAT